MIPTTIVSWFSVYLVGIQGWDTMSTCQVEDWNRNNTSFIRRSQSAVSYPSQTSRNILYKNSEKLHGIFFTRIVRNMFFPFLIWVKHKKCLYSFQSLRLSFLLYSLFNNEDMCIVLTIPWLLTAHKDKSLLSLLVHSFSPIVTSQTYLIPATTYKYHKPNYNALIFKQKVSIYWYFILIHPITSDTSISIFKISVY